MTIDDITSIVRLLLGISKDDGFELSPNISTPTPPKQSLPYTNVHTDVHPSADGAVHLHDIEFGDGRTLSSTTTRTEIPNQLLLNSIGNTFIKISRCDFSLSRYCIETGTFQSNTPLDKVKTIPHVITTLNKGYTSLNGKAIKAILDNKELIQKVLESKSVLPELYLNYFTLFESENTVDKNEVIKLFGKDLEGEDDGKKKAWDQKAKPYEQFKNDHMIRIQERLNDTRYHKTYGLDKDQFDKLKSTRPLEITTPTQIEIDPNTDNISDIINNIDQSVKQIIFTNLSEKWWSKLEDAGLRKTVNSAEKEKNERINMCYGKEHTRECGGD